MYGFLSRKTYIWQKKIFKKLFKIYCNQILLIGTTLVANV